MKTKCRVFLSILYSIVHAAGFSQATQWAFNVGNSQRQEAYRTNIDRQGNILVTGIFEGTVDFDPGPGVFNLTSNGDYDIFVAKYSPSGTFISAFSIGGVLRDAPYYISTDNQNNILLTGYFRGTVDFDPGPGIYNLVSNGEAGSDPGYGGDCFVAKYTSSGNFIMAFKIGGSTFDNGLSIQAGSNDDIIVTGYFRSENVDFDPGPGTYILNASSGTIFLARYTSTGGFLWAFNTGLGDADNSSYELKLDNSGNIYVTGYYQGINIDFDPGPGTALLSSNGNYDIFIAKYTSAGNYVWAKSIGGPGFDISRSVALDEKGNLYMTGEFQGAVDFDPGSGVYNLTSHGGASDFFVLKLDNNGNFIWAKNTGNSQNEIGGHIDYKNGQVVVTGFFQGSNLDFDPGPATAISSSNGGYDIYAVRYDTSGNYQCHFTIGGANDDGGYWLIPDNNSNWYISGFLNSSTTNFQVSNGAPIVLSTFGGFDAFLMKVNWSPKQPDGYIIGGLPQCPGDSSKVLFNAVSGSAPFSLVINLNGTNYSFDSVFSVATLTLPPVAVNTICTITSLSSSDRCSQKAILSDTALITVAKLPLVNAGPDTAFCAGYNYQFHASGANNYQWSPSAGLSNAGIANPLFTGNQSESYILKGTGINGCVAYDTIALTVRSLPFLSRSPDTTICAGGKAILSAGITNGNSINWSPVTNLSFVDSVYAIANPATTTLYHLQTSDKFSCTSKDSIRVSVIPAPVFSVSPASNLCVGTSMQLNAAGGDSYSWSPNSYISNPSTSAPVVSPVATTDYTVIINNSACKVADTLTTNVQVNPAPIIKAARSNDIECSGTSQLNAVGGIRYSWQPASLLNDPSVANPVASPYQTTTFMVTGYDANGCSNKDSVTVNVGAGFNANNYLVPNAFTPNNDGLNDCFGIRRWGNVQVERFDIFNRWGQIIFSTKNPSVCWDGTFRGELQPAGVYVYIIKARSLCGPIEKTGTVVLIR